MSNTCEVCGTIMKPLFISSYCPNECDRKIGSKKAFFEIGSECMPITEILQNYAIKELQDAVDKYFIECLAVTFHVPSNLIYPWSGDDFPIG